MPIRRLTEFYTFCSRQFASQYIKNLVNFFQLWTRKQIDIQGYLFYNHTTNNKLGCQKYLV